MSAAAFETPESGAWRRPRRPMASAPGLAALSSTGGLDPLILSTQPGEAFLSHSGDSTIRAPPGSRLGGSLWHRFPRPWSPLQGEVGCGTEDGAPLGLLVLFALLQPRLPRVPGRASPTVDCPRGALSTSLGGGLLPPPCLSEETGPRRSHPTPSPPQEPQ